MCVCVCVCVCVCLFIITWANYAPPNFPQFDDVVFNLRAHSKSSLSCLSSSLLHSSFMIYLLTPEEEFVCRKRLCFNSLVPCIIGRISEYISLDLFYIV